jgi:hypothetical protein
MFHDSHFKILLSAFDFFGTFPGYILYSSFGHVIPKGRRIRKGEKENNGEQSGRSPAH